MLEFLNGSNPNPISGNKQKSNSKKIDRFEKYEIYLTFVCKKLIIVQHGQYIDEISVVNRDIHQIGQKKTRYEKRRYHNMLILQKKLNHLKKKLPEFQKQQ